eukprot:g4647.t1
MDRYLGAKMFCKECMADSDIFVDPRAGEIICRTCAVVIGERCIDDGAEWRTFVDDSSNGRADPNRCGAAESPLLSAKSGMNTLIEGGRDGKLTAKLQRLQGMAVKESASERALKTDFFAKLREFGHRLGLTHAMQEYACLMLRKAEDSGLFKFKKAERGEAICVAVTLLTCRHWRRAQTMKEMATIFNVPLKAINKAVKRPFRAMYEQRGRLITLEFLERRAAKGVTLETLKPVLA